MATSYRDSHPAEPRRRGSAGGPESRRRRRSRSPPTAAAGRPLVAVGRRRDHRRSTPPTSGADANRPAARTRRGPVEPRGQTGSVPIDRVGRNRPPDGSGRISGPVTDRERAMRRAAGAAGAGGAARAASAPASPRQLSGRQAPARSATARRSAAPRSTRRPPTGQRRSIPVGSVAGNRWRADADPGSGDAHHRGHLPGHQCVRRSPRRPPDSTAVTIGPTAPASSVAVASAAADSQHAPPPVQRPVERGPAHAPGAVPDLTITDADGHLAAFDRGRRPAGRAGLRRRGPAPGTSCRGPRRPIGTGERTLTPTPSRSRTDCRPPSRTQAFADGGRCHPGRSSIVDRRGPGQPQPASTTGDPDFRISLTSQMTVRAPDQCGWDIPLEASCYNGWAGRVFINDARWIRGAMSYNGDLAALSVLRGQSRGRSRAGHASRAVSRHRAARRR